MHAKSPVVFLKRAFQNSPWFVMAIALHAIVIAIAAISYMHRTAEKEDLMKSQIAIAPPRAALPDIEEPPPPIERNAPPPMPDAGELVRTEDADYIPSFE